MTEGDPGQEDATLFPRTAGERLRAAREAEGLSLDEVANRTRVPLRHLQAIESGDYSGLPSATYAIGFAKAYARAVGADEREVGAQVRDQLNETSWRQPEYQPYETEDRAHVPSRGLAWLVALVAAVLLLGVGLWYGTSWFRSEEAAPLPAETVAVPPPSEIQPATATTGNDQVTLVATDTVWVKVSDASGKVLFQREMAANERYDVPRDADHPVLDTGRPDKLSILLNGSAVMPLGTGATAIHDVGVSAEAITSRGATPATDLTAPGNSTAPAAATPKPAASTAKPATTVKPVATTPKPHPATSTTTAPANSTAPVTTPPPAATTTPPPTNP